MQKCWIQFFDGQIMFSQKVEECFPVFSPEYQCDPTRLHQSQWKLLPEWHRCEVSILLGLVTFLHFHEILPHCDPKHIFPFLLALVISHRKPRRFFTYTHELLDCNIATHTFFSTQTDPRDDGHFGYHLYWQNHQCMLHGHFVLLAPRRQRLSHVKIVSHHGD